MTARRHLVLVGGGHTHVQVLEAFARTPPAADLTVIVDRPVAMYSGMAPGFVAGQYQRRELEIDVRPLAARCNATVVVSACVRIDARARRLVLQNADSVEYDLASVNIGSSVLGLELPGVATYTVPTRPLHVLIDRVDDVVTRAREHGGPAPFRVLVVGGGAGGVELAFTMQHRLTAETGRRVETCVLDGGARILPRYPASLVRRVERLFARRGIVVRNDVRVVSAGPQGVTLDDGTQEGGDVVLWVTGPVSHPVFVESGLPTDDRGFVRIRSTLQVEGVDDLLAAGDCGTLVAAPDTPKAGVYAVREGPVIAENLRAMLAGTPLRRYRPQRDFLTLLNVGGGRALGVKWGIAFGGRWVMWWKDRLDRSFVRRFQGGT